MTRMILNEKSKNMTYKELMKKFLDICPVPLWDYCPYGQNAICIWTKDGKALKATYMSDDEFRVERTTTDDWARDVLGE